MKKFVLVIVLAMLFSFMFPGISEAGQCIYLYSYEGSDYYYDSAEVRYSGDIVSFALYKGGCMDSAEMLWELEINCTKKMIRDLLKFSAWKSITPGSLDDTLRIKFCK